MAERDYEKKLIDFLRAFDAMAPERPRGLALHPGYRVWRANGEYLGQTKRGDRITQGRFVAGRPAGVRLPMPVGHLPEWVCGEIQDDQGPWCTQGSVVAAAVDPHTP